MPTSRKDNPPVDDPAQMTDDELAAASQQAAVDAGTEVVLAVGYPHDEFVPFGKDDPDHTLVITAAGTAVPAGRVDDIKAAAKAADVTVREVK